MRGYPKHIATKQDFDNLLAMPDHKDRALKDLKKLQAIDDAKVVKVVSGSAETADLVTEEIDNPNPAWKQKGYKDKKALDDLVTATEVAIDGK
jgi:hypothetical protein